MEAMKESGPLTLPFVRKSLLTRFQEFLQLTKGSDRLSMQVTFFVKISSLSDYASIFPRFKVKKAFPSSLVFCV